MLEDMDDSSFKREHLDSKSPSFCAAKWYNATIWLETGMTASCHHPSPHGISKEAVQKNPKALHNTPEKKIERTQMQKGERPTGCSYCWRVEDLGAEHLSDRVFKSKLYSAEELERIYRASPEKDVDLITLELAFDRRCNFACSYCSFDFSTTWNQDLAKNGPYTNLHYDRDQHYTSHPDDYNEAETNFYFEAFMKWWQSDLHQTLRELRITGGEPLVSPSFWRFMEWFKGQPNQVALAINSNLGVSEQLIEKFVRLSHDTQGISLYTSNESFGAQAEYIRDGLKWELWLNHMDYVLKEAKLKSLYVMCTINALCLDSLPEFLDLLLEKRKRWKERGPHFSLSLLPRPWFQSPLVLPQELREFYADRLGQWLSHAAPLIEPNEKMQVQRVISYLKSAALPDEGKADLKLLQKDFYQFFHQYDQRRGKNFEKVFSPRLVEWFSGLEQR